MAKKKSHQDLVEAAKLAIAAVGSDTSVEPEDTIQSLDELAMDIEARVDALNDDVKNSLEGIE